ncbi:hypothetical protein DSO57_1023478 [Entomophthora muscae]|uniref:Uncharacterized protein n=2 Tax=Entomophthora muscae TaxID=34485 RepID=A0ACC2SFP7_9FUNG|nr:hypothetical protein DSO57_1023478 [Entomophthora muscae]
MNSFELCCEIDKTYCEYLELVEAYQQQLNRINLLINNGYLELAQAKYIMGPNKITRYQYDKRMQATTCFEWNEADSTGEPKWHMSLNNLPKDSTRVTDTVDSPPTSFIRKRGPRLTDSMPEPKEFSINDFKESSKECEDDVQMTSFISATESVAKQARRNPVNWFGVLTPAPLRNAQSSFQQTVLELTACVNLKVKIDKVHTRLELLQSKNREEEND